MKWKSKVLQTCRVQTKRRSASIIGLLLSPLVSLTFGMWLAAASLVFLFFFWRGLPLAYHVRVLLHVLYARLLLPRPGSWCEETVLHFRAWPDDLDWNRHMNNSSYNKLCDIGRIAHLARFFDANVNGANGAVLMRFKRSLGPLQAFELRTRLLGADAKWLWCEHRFVAGGRCVAAGIAKLLVPAAARAAALPDLPPSEPPEAARCLLLAEPHFGRDP